jgi:hypothetical protein
VSFAGSAGSPLFAYVEAIDLTTRRITVTYPRAATGGATDGRVSRATVRVTDTSVLQQVVTTSVTLSRAVDIGATTLSLGAGAPAARARAEVTLVSHDACGAEVRQTVVLAETADAGAGDWILNAPVPLAVPTGSMALIAEVKPLALADLAVGDVLSSAGTIQFGLMFTGTPDNYVVTRLLRSCKSDFCPTLAR